jgi:hypothetical protein
MKSTNGPLHRISSLQNAIIKAVDSQLSSGMIVLLLAIVLGF